MFILGAVFLVAAAAMAGYFGVATSLSEAFAYFAPSSVYGMPPWVRQMGGADAWHYLVQPVLGMPCWAPFLALGAVFILRGVLRSR